ncbi:MAG TPA: RsmB/NOP family class I SAM-dependent RNA methyltransferase [Kiritimatiellia bacterium]|nr:RsmB/NOP family class I SAM-dependent RNA methyltransferase [Kiritimatiellia bacterium]HMO97978.1 RsmB/NOP family class I SAM-dependent RNA methyltransferase [Kiritimatiellia bacterium]HMP95329.1 RsmB/NOP family class I SAM-dependent RNA methyltransferase [Kiritimatiellia bacterium]
MSDRRRQRQIEIAAALTAEIERDVATGIPADAATAAIFRRHPEFGSQDRRHYRMVIFAYFRWLGWTRILAPHDQTLRCAWAVTLDPGSSDDYVSLWAPLTNQTETERSAIRGDPLAFVAEHVGLTLDQLMPDWLVEALPDAVDRQRLIRACLTRPPAWLAIPEDRLPAFKEMLTAQRIPYRDDHRLVGALALEPAFHLELLQRAWGGAIQVQDIASQCVVAACAARPGERWWDVCAGAGGKTIGLALNSGPTGRIFATDARSSILDNLNARSAAHRLTSIETRLYNAIQDAPVEDHFDGVLVDAPCSGIGTWPRNPDARWRTGPDQVRHGIESQRALLRRVAENVRPGGVLVYSVCTITRQEGPDHIAELLHQRSDLYREPFDHPLRHEPTDGTLMIHPDEGPGDGMFIARLRRR